MAKNAEYRTDNEAMEIAVKLAAKYDAFQTIDIGKICFLRMEKDKSKDVFKLTPTKFPFDISSPHIYYVQIYNKQWNLLNENQKLAAIFEVLVSIPEAGTDYNGNNYAKLRRKDVDQYSEVLAAVAGNYEWHKTGAIIPNLLDDTVAASVNVKLAEDGVDSDEA